MDSSVCKICQHVFETDSGLHKHLKSHKLNVESYYSSLFPRRDLYDNVLIKFKNKDQYFDTDFNNRINLKKWIKSKPREEVKDYIKSLLVKRKEKKNLTYSPCQLELRSLITPPVKIYNEFFENYYKLCESIGLINKFKNFDEIVCSKPYTFDKYKIYIDSREQKPLVFDRPSEIRALKFGDYTFSDKEATGNCYVERKSVNDLIGTLSGGYDRFLREIERAKNDNAYFIILVEESFANCMSFNYLPHVFKKGTRVTPEFIFHNVREIIQNNLNLQFLFVQGRKEASRVLEKIFTCDCSYKSVDLQFAYDEGRL